MDLAQHERVQHLFELCRELSGAERDLRLTSDAGDAEVESEVRGLLAAYDGSANFLEQPALERHAGILQEAIGQRTEPALGTRIGHYEIGVAIGSGGMGTVYRARDTRL